MQLFFRNILRLLSPDEKREMYGLLVAMFFLGLVEFAGVGSILPFMQVVSDKNMIHENKLLEYLFSFGGFTDERLFLVAFGIGVLILIIFNNGYTAYVNWRIFHFSWMRNASISTRVFNNYLNRPYEFYLDANTSDLEKNLFDEVRMVVVGILNPILMMAKNLISISAVLALLIYINPVLTLLTFVCLGGAYVALFSFVSKYLKKIGAMRAEANKIRFKTADEALKGIKELNVLERKEYFLNKFGIYSDKLSLCQARKNVVSKLPKHAFEVIAFGGILLIIIYFLALDYELSMLIPVLSLYAFAGYRLMPALQTIFLGVSEVRYTKPALDSLLRDLTQDLMETSDHIQVKDAENNKKSDEIKEIAADGIWYSYPGHDEPVLKGVNFTINSNTTVGIIGTTGSGKTTLVDILLGLLPPSKGCFRINAQELSSDNLYKWKARVGYVPQDIFFLDDTVINNIAYGVISTEIDHVAVVTACKLAKIHDTIVSELGAGYETVIGERGVKLSGGQRQRLGIARALYSNPDVLIFDEGTSALDNITESELMWEIQSLAGKKTIIMIAHRLTTLQSCDKILYLENGVVAESGSYNELAHRCDLFVRQQGQINDCHKETN